MHARRKNPTLILQVTVSKIRSHVIDKAQSIESIGLGYGSQSLTRRGSSAGSG